MDFSSFIFALTESPLRSHAESPSSPIIPTCDDAFRVPQDEYEPSLAVINGREATPSPFDFRLRSSEYGSEQPSSSSYAGYHPEDFDDEYTHIDPSLELPAVLEGLTVPSNYPLNPSSDLPQQPHEDIYFDFAPPEDEMRAYYSEEELEEISKTRYLRELREKPTPPRRSRRLRASKVPGGGMQTSMASPTRTPTRASRKPRSSGSVRKKAHAFEH